MEHTWRAPPDGAVSCPIIHKQDHLAVCQDGLQTYSAREQQTTTTDQSEDPSETHEHATASLKLRYEKRPGTGASPTWK